jgi:transcriptional regulator of acetoin/glycerol metabolism
MTDDIQLPPDLQLKMMVVHQQHLTEQNQQILKMLYLHDQEMALLWLAFCGMLALVLLKDRNKKKEQHGSIA